MRTLVFFVEEPSAREMLLGVLPKILPTEVDVRFVVFEGKQDLKLRIERKLRGWRLSNCQFIILCDQDRSDCIDLKSTLSQSCINAGKSNALVRIACKELESFYLGDLMAVEKGLELPRISKKQVKSGYRDPDRKIGNPSQELQRLTDRKYQKISGSRAIARHMNLDNNSSHSFNVLINGIKSLLGPVKQS